MAFVNCPMVSLSFLPVLLAASIASLGGILFGLRFGIIAGALLQVREIFDLSCDVQQLVVGSVFFSAFVTSFFGGVLVDNLGRKRALLLATALFLGGSALQSVSTGLAMFVTARFITGFAISLSTTAQCTYIAEISPAVHRGLLMSLSEVGITAGFLFAYMINYAFISYENGWQLMFGVATLPALLELVGTLFLPQSPHFLVLKGRHDEARKALTVIHGENAASQELGRMQKSLMEEQNYRYRDLFAPGLRGRMLVGVGLVVLQQCTGQTNVTYYAPTLLQHLGFCSNVAATLASVGLGVVKVGSAIFALLVLDRLGRRICLLSGTLLMAVSIFALGILAKYSYGGGGHAIPLRCRDGPALFNDSERLPEATEKRDGSRSSIGAAAAEEYQCVGVPKGSAIQRALTLAALMTYVFAYGVGFGTTTWLILSEIFPAAVRGRAIAVATSANWAANVVVSASFLTVLDILGIGDTLLMYSGVCMLSLVFIFLCVPETKHKTLEEITSELDQGLNRWRTILPRRWGSSSDYTLRGPA
ncbi:solute carrier family 2, facilitated glucose transporter member 12-like [Dermacentor silvarum]|uniref:solute carrier family 2, facilitated glucose transporter member 12-like n=1 Tax=Dermacentor silvarum TaxID=543639 RepID=UPI001896AC18|nr:solute carrier family 2, facilitated glucose transporter member 12-like [Dermacentor silvarum]